MYVLGIESTTGRLSIAISRRSMLLYQNTLLKEAVFMSRVIPLIDGALRKVKIDISSIDIFAVDTGPGDFTGTRIGISVAKSFSMANARPVFGIPAPDIFATGLVADNSFRILSLLKKGYTVLLFPVLDVRHDELFSGIYRVNLLETGNSIARISTGGKDHFVEKLTPGHLLENKGLNSIFETVIDNAGLEDILQDSRHIIFSGGTAFRPGAGLQVDIKKRKHNFILGKKNLYPRASFLNMCAFYRVLKQTESRDKDYPSIDFPVKIKGDSAVLPIYVREFIPFARNAGKSVKDSSHG